MMKSRTNPVVPARAKIYVLTNLISIPRHTYWTKIRVREILVSSTQLN